jgi:hypothetical protein
LTPIKFYRCRNVSSCGDVGRVGDLHFDMNTRSIFLSAAGRHQNISLGCSVGTDNTLRMLFGPLLG